MSTDPKALIESARFLSEPATPGGAIKADSVAELLGQLADALTDALAENAALRQEQELLVWNLAGCDCVAGGHTKPFDYSQELKRPALDTVSRMADKLALAEANAAKLHGYLSDACDLIDSGSAYCGDCDLGQRAGDLRAALAPSPGSALLEELRVLRVATKNMRWNIEETEGGFRVCRGEHEKGVCAFVDYVPRERAETAEAALAAARKESTARLDTCIQSDDLLHRLFRECKEMPADLRWEIQNYMDMGEWPVEMKRESLNRQLAVLSDGGPKA